MIILLLNAKEEGMLEQAVLRSGDDTHDLTWEIFDANGVIDETISVLDADDDTLVEYHITDGGALVIDEFFVTELLLVNAGQKAIVVDSTPLLPGERISFTT